MGRPIFKPDLSPSQVATILGYPNADAFLENQREYEMRGLRPDPTTGRYDPEGLERWRRLRNPNLFPDLTSATTARDAATVFEKRLRGG